MLERCKRLLGHGYSPPLLSFKHLLLQKGHANHTHADYTYIAGRAVESCRVGMGPGGFETTTQKRATAQLRASRCTDKIVHRKFNAAQRNTNDKHRVSELTQLSFITLARTPHFQARWQTAPFGEDDATL